MILHLARVVWACRPARLTAGPLCCCDRPIGRHGAVDAAARVVESRRPDCLFGDLWATRLPGSDGFAALEQHSSANPFPALRTWRFDGWCTRVAAGGCQPVVLLAVTPRAAHDRARE